MMRHSATVPCPHWLMIRVELAAQRFEIRDLPINFRELFARYGVDGFARAAALVE